MCGIVGSVGGRVPRPAVEAAVERLQHRGPDDRGVEHLESAAGDVWLGFRRLSILDLSPLGHQPMYDARRELCLVFNGEIYNFRELRAELEAKGHRFVSGTDTEVILYGYREWGAAAVTRFIGMFAFALWDARTQELVLARDRLGIKPLYYHQAPGRLAFGSEIKSLLALPGVDRRLDPQAAAKFFNFLWVPEPETLLEGVRQLEPGTLARYRDGVLRTESYWDVPLDSGGSTDEPEAVDALDDLLFDSVRKRLVSDVPLGAFLSGGVDSSLIVAMMRRAEVPRIVTQTVEHPADAAAYDIEPVDAPYARKVRDHFGDLDYHEISLRPRVAELLPRLVWHLDDPVADPAALSTYLICRAAKENATVMLSGMGAEELFAGYGRHRAVLLAERYRALPRGLRQGLLEPVIERLPASRPGPLMTLARNAKKFVRSADRDVDQRYFGYLSYYSNPELAALLAVDVDEAALFSRHRQVLERARGADPVLRMSYLDLKTFLPNLNLTYTDRASMAASVEVRVPILDHRVVELVARMPTSLKMRGRTQKYVLKQVALRYLPREIVTRRKTGFAAPFRAWVARDLRPLIQDVLAPERLARRGVVDPAAAWSVIEDVWSGREDNALRVWALLTFELWAETFLDRDGSVAVAA